MPPAYLYPFLTHPANAPILRTKKCRAKRKKCIAKAHSHGRVDGIPAFLHPPAPINPQKF
jgi:hypothetical protein